MMHSHRTSTGFKMHINAFPTESLLQIRIFLRTVYNLSSLSEQRRKKPHQTLKTNKQQQKNPTKTQTNRLLQLLINNLKYWSFRASPTYSDTNPARLIRELCFFPLHQKAAASESLMVSKPSPQIHQLKHSLGARHGLKTVLISPKGCGRSLSFFTRFTNLFQQERNQR